MVTKIKKQELLNTIETAYKKIEIPNIQVGDTVKLGMKIEEGEKIIPGLKTFVNL